MNRMIAVIVAITLTTASLSYADTSTTTAQTAIVPDLLKSMDGSDLAAAKVARQTLFALTQKSAGGPDQHTVAVALSGELSGKHNIETSRQICEILAFFNDEPEVVDALAKAMHQPDLQESARAALVRIPGRAASDSLTSLISQADDTLKVAILNGLAERADASALPALLEQIASPSDAVQAAAWNALAHTPSPDAFAAFGKAIESKNVTATAALLDYVSTLLDAGMLEEAEKSLKLREQAGPAAGLDKCKMLRAYARLGTPQAISYVLDALDNDSDPRVHGAALNAAAILPSTDFSRELTDRMVKAAGQAKLDLLDVLGRRGKMIDDGTVMVMYMAMLDKDENVKIACVRAMQAAGITSTVPTLLNFAAGKSPALADAAEQALAHTPGDAIAGQIVTALKSTSAVPTTKVRLLRALGQRGEKATLPAMIEATADKDVQVRAAAFGALGRFADEDNYATLLAGFDAAPGPDRDAAEKAMMTLDSDVITAKLLSSYFEVAERQKPSLLHVLAPRQLGAIDALLATEATSHDEAIRQAAVEGICQRANPEAAPILLEAAKAGPGNITATCMEGYAQMARKLESTDKAAAGLMYAEAIKLTRDDEHRKPALLGVGRCSAASTPGLIDVVRQCAQSEGLRAESAMAMAGLASRMPDAEKAGATKLLEEARSLSQDAAVQRAAIRRLRELGQSIDPAREQGFITCWWLAGPVPRQGNSGWDLLPAGMADVDLAKPVTIEGKECTWKKDYSPDPSGTVDLIDVFGPSNSLAVFGYAEITVDQATEATFKAGSDDGIAVWVNGQKLHANNAFRQLKVDEDVFKAPLKAGKNTVLVKVLQARDFWSFCLRVVGADDKPLPLQQRTQ